MPVPADPDRPRTTAEVRLTLVHSPLTGPDLWQPTAAAMRERGWQVLVPRVRDDLIGALWAAHVDSVADAVGEPDVGATTLVLVLHGDAGALADLLVTRLADVGHLVEGVIFADAGLPAQGRSRIAQLWIEDPPAAEALQEQLQDGPPPPPWPDHRLRSWVPDGARRRRLQDGFRSMPPGYWQEVIPSVEVPEHHRAVLRFSPTHPATAEVGMRLGWPVLDLRTANHFLPLTDEAVVAMAVTTLVDRLIALPDGNDPGRSR